VTYSRPGIRQVGVGAGQQLSNNQSIELPGPGRVSANAPFRDKRNPAQAAKNVEIKYKGINALLEFANSETTRKYVREQIDRQAKKEAGSVLDAYPPTATTSQNNPEADAAYNALSPRAKDFVIEARAAGAVSAYSKALPAQLVKETILTAPGSTAEQRAEAQARATNAARDASGLSALPSYQLVVNADKIASIDGSVKGQAYQTRIVKEADLAQVGLIQGAASELFDGFKGLEKVGADDSAGDLPLTTGLDALVQGIIDQAGNNFGPSGQANILAGGIFEVLNRLTDPQEKLELVQRLQAMAASPRFGADGKTDIFSIPLGDTGKSIKDVLAEQTPQLEAGADNAMMGAAFLQMEELRLNNDVEGARNLGLQTLGMLNDQTKIPAFINQIEALTQRVTPEMRVNANKMFERELDGESASSLVKKMITADVGTYPPQAINQMFSLARQESNGERTNNPYKQSHAEFNSARKNQSSEFDIGFANYLKYTEEGQTGSYSAGQSGEELNLAGKRNYANFLSEARQRYFELREEGLAKNDWDPAKGIQQAIDETVGTKKENMVGAGNAPATPLGAYAAWGNTSSKVLAETAASNGGRIANENIPASAIVPSTLKVWQQSNPGKSFDSLTGRQKLNLLAEGIMTFKKFDEASGQFVPYTKKEAIKKAVEMVEGAEKDAAEGPMPTRDRVPELVPETPEELKQSRRPRMQGYGQKPIQNTMELLEKAAQFAKPSGTQSDPFNFNKIFNNGGFGPQSMSYVDGFLNLTLGAAPANAGDLTYGTPEGLQALRTSWSSGQQGLNTAPLPQVAAATPVRYAPVAITSDKHELFVMVGVAEGTRTASGGYTKAYYGHSDPGDGSWNRGTVSGGRGTNASPQMVDRRWMGTLTNVQQRMRGSLIGNGLKPGTAGFNRVMFNLIDLTVQSPAAARDFAGKLPEIKQKGWTVEAIAKARADSFINPATGRLDAPGFGNNYQRLFKDQRSRAGVYDYRRRI
jgi:hypothetical protein